MEPTSPPDGEMVGETGSVSSARQAARSIRLMSEMEEIDPGLAEALRKVGEEAERGNWGRFETSVTVRVAAAHARAVYAAAESQARSSERLESSTGRLVAATWVLAVATIALVVSTIVLAFVSANS